MSDVDGKSLPRLLYASLFDKMSEAMWLRMDHCGFFDVKGFVPPALPCSEKPAS